MLKTTITVLMLLPAMAFAECGLATTGGTMTIVVGKADGKCFSSGAFAENFKATVADSLADSDAVAAAQRRPYDDRTTRAGKLWSLAERQHQMTRPGGRYFGQR